MQNKDFNAALAGRAKSVMRRADANQEIGELLKQTDLGSKYNLGAEFLEYAKAFPQQRAGQIITNYITPDYRSNPSVRTKEILESLFPGDPDPFFEESVETLARLKKTLKK